MLAQKQMIGVHIPPIDQNTPAVTETATFALG